MITRAGLAELAAAWAPRSTTSATTFSRARPFGSLLRLLQRANPVDEGLDREPVARVPVVALLERLADLGCAP